jgi:hypothetical protein
VDGEDREKSVHYQLGRLAMAARLHLVIDSPSTRAELKRLVDAQLDQPVKARGVVDGQRDGTHEHLERRRRERCLAAGETYRYEPRPIG